MDTSLAYLLVKAKEKDKWIPVKYLVKHHFNLSSLLQLEDDDLLLIKHRSSDGLLIKLTLKGYHHFK